MAGWTSPVGRLLGAAYAAGVRREWLARPAGRLLWGTDTAPLYAAVRALAGLPAGSAVLDVPCGAGLALDGVRPGVRYVGVDVSPAMLGRTRRRAGVLGLSVELVEADVGALPFDDGAFDVCVCLNGLHCLPDPAGAVRELARCLRPGGRLTGDAVVTGAGARQDLAVAVLRRLGLFGPGGTADALRAWLVSAGLRVERFTRYGAVVHFAAVRDGTGVHGA